ncbi:hypothetical protein ACU686_00985 [Yinghuangia aomiensis]
MAALVRDRLGAGADDAFCRACHAVTDGIPYIVGQLVGEVADRDLRPTAANARKLAGLAAAIVGRGMIARLERAGIEAVRLARAVAVLGTDATLGRAAALAGLDTDAAVAPGRQTACRPGVRGERPPRLRASDDRHRGLPADPAAGPRRAARAAARLLIADGHEEAQASTHLRATYPNRAIRGRSRGCGPRRGRICGRARRMPRTGTCCGR